VLLLLARTPVGHTFSLLGFLASCWVSKNKIRTSVFNPEDVNEYVLQKSDAIGLLCQGSYVGLDQ